MTYMYRCSNKNCSAVEQSNLRLNTGWKSSCCNLCDNVDCPDYGECKCFDKSDKKIIDADMIEKLQKHHKNNDIEIETFE